MITFIVRRVRAKRQAQAEANAAAEAGPTEQDVTNEKTDAAPDQQEASAGQPAKEELPSKENTSDERTVKKARRIYRLKLCVGLVIPYMLSSLDLTIVATTTPLVASYFGKLNQINWIATAYTLTSTAFIPTYGQLADIFGRHAALQLAVVCVLIGSVLCAAAQTWEMFLLGRGIQGLGAAGIMNLIRIILSDKVSLAENSKNTSIFSFVGGISFGIGPVIGGYLTSASWRYCFVLPIPLSVIASAILFFLLRKELLPGSSGSISNAFATIDTGGTFLFVFGVGLIILGTAWGGSTYAWDSAAVVVPLVLGALLFAAFFVYEYLLEPGRVLGRKFPRQVSMIPWSLFSRQDTLLLAVVNFATGAALYSIFYFMSIYFDIAQGLKASKSGLYLLFYIPGIGAGVYASFFLCNKWPRQTYYPLLMGSVIEATGFALLTWAVTTPHIGIVQGMMAVAGAGTGLRFMPGTLHAVGVWPNKIAAALSVMDFALPFGGTLALTIMGSVFNNKLVEYLHGLAVSGPGFQSGKTSSGGLGALKKLPPYLQTEIRHFAGKAVMWAFASILPLMGLCVLSALMLGNVWIRGKKKGGSTFVVYTSFLVYCFTGRGQTSESE